MPTYFPAMLNEAKRLAGAVGRTLVRFSSWGSGIGGQWRGFLPGTKANYEKEAGDLWRHSSVACCLAWIVRNGREPCVQVVKRDKSGGDVPIVGHPLSLRCDRPNPFYDWPTLMSGLILSLCCDGNGYLRKVVTNGGDVVELWYVPHWAIAPVWAFDGTEYIGAYEYWTDTGRVYLPIEDVIHVRDGIDPLNERRGLAPLKSLLREIVGDTAFTTMTAAIGRNMGVPSWMFAPAIEGAQFGDESVKRLIQFFKGRTSGDEAGSPLALTDPITATRLGFSPDELAIEKLHKIPESRICSALGVPPQVVGLLSGEDRKTYSNYGEAREAAYDDCLEPLWCTIARALTLQLLERDFDRQEGERVTFDKSTIKALQPNKSDILADAIKGFQGGIYTLNQALAMIGMPPEADGEIRLVPGTLKPLEQVMEPPQPPPDMGGGFGGDYQAQDEGDEADGTVKALANGHADRWGGPR